MRQNYPVMLYDGDCVFCKRWIVRWSRLTKDKVMYKPYQESLSDFPELSEAKCQKAVQFIEPDGTVYEAAEAVLRTLTYTKHYGWLYRLYQKSRFFASIAEYCYRWVARNRGFLTRIGL